MGSFQKTTLQEELFAVVALQWKDLQEIEFLKTYIFVLKAEDTKNNKDRAIICNSIARTQIDEQRDNGSKYIWPEKKVGLENRIWNYCWKKTGWTSDPLISKGAHNCRHTFAYRLRALGVWQEDRDELMGHHNANITQHYAQPALPRLVDASETVAKGYLERTPIVMLRSG